MLLDEGVLVPTDRDVWDAVPERLDSQHVPSTLVGVLQARHDALPVEERVALQQASVIGFVFWDRAVAALDNGSPRSLAPLARRGFVKPQPGSSIADAEEFTFEHHLLQQFTYDSVLKRQRCEYHALAAAWLATLAAERGPEFHGATGEHYELAGESAMAVDHYTRAAENAAARDARATALEYVTRALALTPPDDHAIRWRLVLTRESIVAIAGDPAEHDSALDALAMLADALDDDAKRAEAGLRRTLALMDRGEHYAGIIEGQRVIDLATRAGTPRLAALAYAELARAARRTNRAREAADLAARGLDLAREVGDPAVEAALLHALATACSDNGDVMSDRRFTGQALDLARRTGNRLLEARLLNNIGTIEITLGEFDDAGETWETALTLSRELEWTYGESIVLLNLAGLATATGANEEAITQGHGGGRAGEGLGIARPGGGRIPPPRRGAFPPRPRRRGSRRVDPLQGPLRAERRRALRSRPDRGTRLPRPCRGRCRTRHGGRGARPRLHCGGRGAHRDRGAIPRPPRVLHRARSTR